MKKKKIQEIYSLLISRATRLSALTKVDSLKKSNAIYLLQQAIVNMDYQDNQQFRGFSEESKADMEFLEVAGKSLAELDVNAAVRAFIHFIVINLPEIFSHSEFVERISTQQKWLNILSDANSFFYNLGPKAEEAAPILFNLIAMLPFDKILTTRIIMTLKKIGSKIEEYLVNFLKTTPPNIEEWRGRALAIWLLGEINATNSIEIVRRELINPDHFVKAKAAETLGILKAKEALKDLCAVALDQSLEIDPYRNLSKTPRQFFIKKRGSFTLRPGKKRFIPIERSSFFIEKKPREAALEALGKIGDRRAIPTIQKIIKNNNEQKQLQLLATRILGQIDKEGETVDELLALMFSKEPIVYKNAIKTLITMPPSLFVPKLVQKIISIKNPSIGWSRAIDFIKEISVEKFIESVSIALDSSHLPQEKKLLISQFSFLCLLVEDNHYGLERFVKHLINAKLIEDVDKYFPIVVPERFQHLIELLSNFTEEKETELETLLANLTKKDAEIAPKLFDIFQNINYYLPFKLIILLSQQLLKFGELIEVSDLLGKILTAFNNSYLSFYEKVDYIDKNQKEFLSCVEKILSHYTYEERKETAIELANQLNACDIETYVALSIVELFKDFEKILAPILLEIKEDPTQFYSYYYDDTNDGVDDYFPELLKTKAEDLLLKISPKYKAETIEIYTLFGQRDKKMNLIEELCTTLQNYIDFVDDEFWYKDEMEDSEDTWYLDNEDLILIEEMISNDSWFLEILQFLRFSKGSKEKLFPVLIDSYINPIHESSYVWDRLSDLHILDNLHNFSRDLFLILQKLLAIKNNTNESAGELKEKRRNVIRLLGEIKTIEILPQWLEILRSKNFLVNEEEFKQICNHLGSFGSIEIVPALKELQLLHSSWEEQLEQLIKKIDPGESAFGRSLEEILYIKENRESLFIEELLQDESIWKQWLAMELLREKQQASKEEIALLKEIAKKTTYWELRQNSLRTLNALGIKLQMDSYTKSFEQLLKELENPFLIIRRGALEEILQSNDKNEKILQKLIEMLETEPNVEIKIRILTDLPHLGLDATKTLPVLVNIIRNEPCRSLTFLTILREKTLEIIDLIARSENLPEKTAANSIYTLRKCITLRNDPLKERIIEVIGVLASGNFRKSKDFEELIVDLLQIMSNVYKKVITKAFEVMNSGKTILEILKKTKDEHLRTKAIEALALMQNKDILPIFVELMKNETSTLAKLRIAEAIESLKEIPGDFSASLIEMASNEQDRNIRFTLLKVLENCVQEDNIDLLIQFYNEEKDYDVSCQIVNTLRRIPSPKVELFLIQVLQQEDDFFKSKNFFTKKTFTPSHSDSNYKISEKFLCFLALEGLVERKSEKAIPTIIQKMHSKKIPALSREAAWALGEIGSKRAIKDLFIAMEQTEDLYLSYIARKVLEKFCNRLGCSSLEELRDL
ncbi:MAG: HEAT repeat domain-containing protein [Candidatus Heimdallarchaeota archaeon]